MPDLKIKIKGDASSLKNALNGAKGSVSKFSATASKGLQWASRGFMALAAAALAAAVNITRIGANFEQTAVAFKTMLGSGNKATAMLEKLTEFSTKTPFTPDEIYKTAKTLLAFGITAAGVHDVIKTIGDVSSATGKDLNELARIYGKVFVKGKMQAEELNQLSEAGVPIIKELQKQYGATAEEIFKMGSAGKLSFGDLDRALKAMTGTGGIFFNAMESQSETLNGKISTLKGNFSELQRTLSELKAPKDLVDFLNKLVKATNELAKENLKSGEGAQLTSVDVIMAKWEATMSAGFDLEERSRLIEQSTGTTQAAPSKDFIDKARIALKKALEDEAAEAKSRKDAMAAGLGGTGAQSAKMLSAANIGGGGTLASLGGDISGGGFSARMNVAQEQLNATIEIRELTREMVKNSTAMTNEGTMAYNRSKTDSIIK